jgi:hypothetical protein
MWKANSDAYGRPVGVTELDRAVATRSTTVGPSQGSLLVSRSAIIKAGFVTRL